MRPSWRILFSTGSSLLATILVLSGNASRTQTIGVGGTQGTAQGMPSHPATAGNWSDAVSELAARILTHATAHDTVALTVRNISSLGEDDLVQIRRDLRSQFRSQHVRLTAGTRASVEVRVSLSENTDGYLWVAEIENSPSRSSAEIAAPMRQIVMLAVAPSRRMALHSVPEPLTIRKTLVYEQDAPMLDFVPLDTFSSGRLGPATAAATTARALVLGLKAVSLYEKVEPTEDQPATWRLKESAPLARLRPWPRDARGRLMMREGSRFNVYLSGENCNGATEPTLTLDCREGEEPWPLGPRGADGSPEPVAYLETERNFFDGRIRLDDGRELKAPPFFSVALLPAKSARPKPGDASDRLWLLAGLDGRARLLNNNAESVANIGGLGSSVVSVHSSCQSGWQVLASQPEDLEDSDVVEAYEIVNRKALAASAPVDFDGPVMELWPVGEGQAAIAICENVKTGSYEAFRLSVSCGQ
jgi:hypothetical protein